MLHGSRGLSNRCLLVVWTQAQYKKIKLKKGIAKYNCQKSCNKFILGLFCLLNCSKNKLATWFYPKQSGSATPPPPPLRLFLPLLFLKKKSRALVTQHGVSNAANWKKPPKNGFIINFIQSVLDPVKRELLGLYSAPCTKLWTTL